MSQSIVHVPVELIVKVKDDVITDVIIQPRESDAGYFGPGTYLYDGDEIDIEKEFWPAMSTMLCTDPNNLGKLIRWEE